MLSGLYCHVYAVRFTLLSLCSQVFAIMQMLSNLCCPVSTVWFVLSSFTVRFLLSGI